VTTMHSITILLTGITIITLIIDNHDVSTPNATRSYRVSIQGGKGYASPVTTKLAVISIAHRSLSLATRAGAVDAPVDDHSPPFEKGTSVGTVSALILLGLGYRYTGQATGRRLGKKPASQRRQLPSLALVSPSPGRLLTSSSKSMLKRVSGLSPTLVHWPLQQAWLVPHLLPQAPQLSCRPPPPPPPQ
jgi:hypothetical protein